jgi:hypothetical protein
MRIYSHNGSDDQQGRKSDMSNKIYQERGLSIVFEGRLELKLKEGYRSFPCKIPKRGERCSSVLTFSRVHAAGVKTTSSVKSASALMARTSFGNVRGIFKPSPFYSGAAATIIGQTKRHLLIGMSHSRALLRPSFSFQSRSISSGASALVYQLGRAGFWINYLNAHTRPL